MTLTDKPKSGYLFSNRDLAMLFIPLIVEQLLAVLVGMTDTIMVAYVSEAAVSGVSLVDNIIILMIKVFGALATGGAVIIGQYLGRRQQPDQAQQATDQLVWFCGIASVMIMALVYLMRGFLLDSVFGEITPEVRAHAEVYMLIVTASIPFIAVFNAGAAVFRTGGNSRIPMLTALLMDGINVAGNALLIYGAGMGTAGAAIATLVSRIVAAVVIVALALDRRQTLRVTKSLRYRPKWKMVKRILGIGVPYGLESGLFQLGKIIVLSLVSSFGTAAIAANAVGSNLAMFEVLPGMAMVMGMTTVISRCVGAGDYEQARYYNKKILQMVYLAQLVMCAIIMAAMPFVLRVYRLSDYTAELTTRIMWLHTFAAIVIWPMAFTLPVTFRAAGDAKYPMFISVMSMFVGRVLLAYILGGYLGLGLFGAWVAMCLDWAIKAVFLIYRYFSGKWMEFKAI